MADGVDDIASLTADDRLEIQELIARYSTYEDTGDADAIAALFTDDGSTVSSRGVSIVGRSAIAEAARRRWEKPEVHREVHWATNIIVEPNAEGAQARSYHMILVVEEERAIRVRGLAAKLDRLRQENGRWLFVQREALPLAAG